ncbi:hypothetical protein [Escherichia phage FL20]
MYLFSLPIEYRLATLFITGYNTQKGKTLSSLPFGINTLHCHKVYDKSGIAPDRSFQELAYISNP